MARVLTFSRTFPAYHPRKREPTLFVEKLWNSIGLPDINFNGLAIEHLYYTRHEPEEVGYKHHTIRSGKRWKVGDKFSPRVWSGKPYASKQIKIAPDIEVKQVWDFDIEVEGNAMLVTYGGGLILYERTKSGKELEISLLNYIAHNDGLDLDDFKAWFKWGRPFSGQIICWNENLNY